MQWLKGIKKRDSLLIYAPHSNLINEEPFVDSLYPHHLQAQKLLFAGTLELVYSGVWHPEPGCLPHTVTRVAVNPVCVPLFAISHNHQQAEPTAA